MTKEKLQNVGERQLDFGLFTQECEGMCGV
jgi:hypothetical protein